MKDRGIDHSRDVQHGATYNQLPSEPADNTTNLELQSILMSNSGSIMTWQSIRGHPFRYFDCLLRTVLTCKLKADTTTADCSAM